MELSHIVTKGISKGVVNNKVEHSTKNKANDALHFRQTIRLRQNDNSGEQYASGGQYASYEHISGGQYASGRTIRLTKENSTVRANTTPRQYAPYPLLLDQMFNGRDNRGSYVTNVFPLCSIRNVHPISI